MLGLADANSAEFEPACSTPVVVFMPEGSTTHKGGTMRLGSRRTILQTMDCITAKLYQARRPRCLHMRLRSKSPSACQIHAANDNHSQPCVLRSVREIHCLPLLASQGVLEASCLSLLAAASNALLCAANAEQSCIGTAKTGG